MLKLLKYLIRNFKNSNRRQLGEINILLSRLKYEKILNLQDAEVKIFSQSGEDGILDYIIQKIKLRTISFIEIGTGDYEEANTRYLAETINCRGLLIDQNKDLNFVKKRDFYWKKDLYLCNEKVSSKNINLLISKFGFDEKYDLLSIDIDGVDFWVLKEINLNKCSIVVLEYNPLFGYNYEVTIPNIENFNRENFSKIYFGASLKAYIALMKEKNFHFIGANSTCCNAFFVNKKYEKDFNNLKIDELSFYTNYFFREIKSNNPFENTKKYLLKKIEEFELVDLNNNKKEKIKNFKYL